MPLKGNHGGWRNRLPKSGAHFTVKEGHRKGVPKEKLDKLNYWMGDNNPKEMATALESVADFQKKKGKFKEASQLYEMGAFALLDAGEVHEGAEAYEKAVKAFDRELDRVRTTGTSDRTKQKLIGDHIRLKERSEHWDIKAREQGLREYELEEEGYEEPWEKFGAELYAKKEEPGERTITEDWEKFKLSGKYAPLMYGTPRRYIDDVRRSLADNDRDTLAKNCSRIASYHESQGNYTRAVNAHRVELWVLKDFKENKRRISAYTKGASALGRHTNRLKTSKASAKTIERWDSMKDEMANQAKLWKANS